ncbi:hypothetical protein [Neomoorella humiferrea]
MITVIAAAINISRAKTASRSFPDFDFKSILIKAAAVNALYGTQVTP